MKRTRHGILVGYDGSPGSEEALGWAAKEARLRGSVLTICHAWAPGYPTPAAGAIALARRSGEQALARGLQYARAIAGPAEVRPLLAEGPAAGALCEHSGDADMVVVGARGQDGLPGLLLGSVSSQVAAHACGRVVVVRGKWRRVPGHAPGPVVAGTDGSAASAGAVAFAFEEAALREVVLLAVCALADAPSVLGAHGQIKQEFDQLISQSEKENPEVTVRRDITDGPARTALLTAAAGAQMLVVGARGRVGIRGMVLGSVSQALLHHAPCPVAVVHPACSQALRRAAR